MSKKIVTTVDSTPAPSPPEIVAPSEATLAVWTARQLALASQLVVPATELYGVATGSSLSFVGAPPASHSLDTLGFCGAIDASFVHREFLLPVKELTGVIAALRLSGSPVHCAMAAQLEHDVNAQQQETLATAAAHGGKSVGGECDHHDVLPQPHPGLPQPLAPLTYIGGIDVSFVPGTSLGVACLAILAYPSLTPVKTFMHHCELTEPYISGFLAFREAQPVQALFATYGAEIKAVGITPQLLFVDGCGVHHPRRCGLASHLGVVLAIPTIGCAKKMLVVDGIGREDVEMCFTTAQTAGAAAVATPRGREAISDAPSTKTVPTMHPILGTTAPNPLFGYALLTTGNSAKKLIFVSPGNGVGFAMAAALVALVCRTRIPEPVRQADLCSRQYIREGRHLLA